MGGRQKNECTSPGHAAEEQAAEGRAADEQAAERQVAERRAAAVKQGAQIQTRAGQGGK